MYSKNKLREISHAWTWTSRVQVHINIYITYAALCIIDQLKLKNILSFMKRIFRCIFSYHQNVAMICVYVIIYSLCDVIFWKCRLICESALLPRITACDDFSLYYRPIPPGVYYRLTDLITAWLILLLALLWQMCAICSVSFQILEYVSVSRFVFFPPQAFRISFR